MRRRTIATLNANNEHYFGIFVWKWAAINAGDFVHGTINNEYHRIFGEFTKKKQHLYTITLSHMDVMNGNFK